MASRSLALHVVLHHLSEGPLARMALVAPFGVVLRLAHELLELVEPAGGDLARIDRRLHGAAGFAFVTAGALSTNGRPVDFRRTRYRAAIDAGMFDGGDQPIIALLEFEHGRWQLKDYVVGPTDVAFAEWWRIHSAPRSIFPFTE